MFSTKTIFFVLLVALLCSFIDIPTAFAVDVKSLDESELAQVRGFTPTADVDIDDVPSSATAPPSPSTSAPSDTFVDTSVTQTETTSAGSGHPTFSTISDQLSSQEVGSGLSTPTEVSAPGTSSGASSGLVSTVMSLTAISGHFSSGASSGSLPSLTTTTGSSSGDHDNSPSIEFSSPGEGSSGSPPSFSTSSGFSSGVATLTIQPTTSSAFGSGQSSGIISSPISESGSGSATPVITPTLPTSGSGSADETYITITETTMFSGSSTGSGFGSGSVVPSLSVTSTETSGPTVTITTTFGSGSGGLPSFASGTATVTVVSPTETSGAGSTSGSSTSTDSETSSGSFASGTATVTVVSPSDTHSGSSHGSGSGATVTISFSESFSSGFETTQTYFTIPSESGSGDVPTESASGSAHFTPTSASGSDPTTRPTYTITIPTLPSGSSAAYSSGSETITVSTSSGSLPSMTIMTPPKGSGSTIPSPTFWSTVDHSGSGAPGSTTGSGSAMTYPSLTIPSYTITASMSGSGSPSLSTFPTLSSGSGMFSSSSSDSFTGSTATFEICTGSGSGSGAYETCFTVEESSNTTTSTNSSTSSTSSTEMSTPETTGPTEPVECVAISASLDVSSSLVEGSTAVLSVSLVQSIPRDVTLRVQCTEHLECEPESVFFLAGYTGPAYISVLAVDDDVILPEGQVSAEITIFDEITDCDPYDVTVPVVVLDNDQAGLSVTPVVAGVPVISSEMGGAETLLISLPSAPSAPVKISFSSDDSSVQFSPAELTATEQFSYVTVSLGREQVNTVLCESATIYVSTSSSDLGVDQLTASLSAMTVKVPSNDVDSGYMTKSYTSDVSALPASLSAGLAVYFTIQARDACSNVRRNGGDGPMFAAMLEAASSTISDNEDGTYAVVLESTLAGTNDLAIAFNNHLLFGFPVAMFTSAAEISAATTTFSGSAVSVIEVSAVDATEASFTIIPHDRFNNAYVDASYPVTSDFAVYVMVNGESYVAEILGSESAAGERVFIAQFSIPAQASSGVAKVSVYYAQGLLASFEVSLVMHTYSAASSTAEGSGVTNYGFSVGQTAEINIVARSASGEPITDGKQQFSVAVQSATGTNLVLSPVYSSAEGCYVATYTVTSTAALTVSIISDGVHIQGSPFAVSALPGATYANLTTAVSGSSSVQAGTTVYLTIHPRDMYGNEQMYTSTSTRDEFAATISSASVPSVESRIVAVDNLYNLTFVPTATGTYTITIYLDSAVIGDGKSFTVQVYAGATSAAKCVVSGSGIASGTTGQSRVVSIAARDAYSNPTAYSSDRFSVVLTMNGATVLTAETSFSTSSQAHTATYVLTSAGTYTIDVQQAFPVKAAISTYIVVVSSTVASASKSSAEGAGYTASVAGVETTFIIEARDDYGNLLASDTAYFSIAFRAPSGSTTQADFRASDTAFLGNGQYLVTYMTTRAGTYTAAITLSGTAISNSGASVVVSANSPVASHSYLSGVVSSVTASTTESSFAVVSRDVYDNAASALDFEVSVSPEVSTVSRSGANVLYSFTQTGVYTIYVTSKSENVAGSPVSITVTAAAVSASFSSATLSSAATIANTTQTLSIDARDIYNNSKSLSTSSVVVTVQGASGAAVATQITSAGSSQFLATFTPTIATQYTIQVALAGQALPASSLTITAAALSASKSYISAVATPVTAGLEGAFTVTATDAFGNVISSEDEPATAAASLINSNGVSTPVVSLAWTDGVYSGVFTETVSGTHKLSVTLNGVSISSTKEVTIRPSATVVAQSLVSGPGISGGVQGVALEVNVQTRDEFSNYRDDRYDIVTISAQRLDANGDPSGSPLTASGAAQGNGLYTGSYTVTGLSVASLYSVSVSVNGTLISTYAVRIYASSSEIIISANQTTLYAPSTGIAGEIYSLYITPRSSDGVTLAGYPCIDSSATQAFQGSLVNADTGATVNFASVLVSPPQCTGDHSVYRIDLNLTAASSYTVRITFAPTAADEREEISGSPATFKITPAETAASGSIITADSVSSRTAGESFSFRITARDLYSNVIVYNDYNGADPFAVTMGSEPCTVLNNQDATYTVSCFARTAGNSKVVATLSGSTIQGSGFKVSIVAGPASASTSVASGSGLTSSTAGVKSSFQISLYDAYGNLASAATTTKPLAFFAGLDSTIDVASASSTNAVYTATYNLTAAGMYLVNVTLADGSAITVSAGPLTVSPAASDARNTLVSLSSEIVASSELSVSVTPRDAWNNIQTSFVDTVAITVQHDSETSPFSGAYLSGSTFSASSTQTTFDASSGKHNISLTLTPSGTYTATVTVNGQSAAVETVQATPLTAPTFTAKMSNNLVELRLTFSASTNKARLSGVFACSKLLASSVVATLGTNPTCSWSSDRILVVTTGSEATVMPQDQLVMLANTVYIKNENSYAVSSEAVSLEMPDSPQQPVAVMSLPNTMGSCDDLDALDLSASTAGGGRPLSYYYSVSSSDPNVTALATYLASLPTSTDSLVIESAYFTEGQTYVFTGSVRDFLGQESSPVSLSTYKASEPSPKVLVERHTVEIPSDELVYVKVTVRLSACTPDNQMLWQWTQVDDGAPSVLSALQSTTIKDLVIPANSLTPGYLYTFTVTGALKNLPDLIGSDSLTLNVTYPSVAVSVVGGSRAVANDFTVRAQACDPANPTTECYDSASGTLPTFSYQWTCATPEGMDCSSEVTFISALAQDTSSIPVASTDLVPGVYIFTVTATETTYGVRTAVTSASLTVLPAGSLIVDVSISPYVDVSVPLNPANKASFQAETAATSPVYLWRCIEGDLVTSQSDDTVLAEALSTSSSSDLLVIMESMLTPGASYTLQLDVSDELTGATGFASVSFTVNSPPSSGTLTVTAKSPVDASLAAQQVYSVNDTIVLVAKNWVDDSSTTFSYVFGYYHGSVAYGDAGTDNLLKQTDSNSIQYPLPGGKGYNNTLTVYVDVFDEFGGSTRASQVVQVVPLELDTAAAASAASACAASGYSDAAGTGDADKAVLMSVNCAAYLDTDSNSAVRRRSRAFVRYAVASSDSSHDTRDSIKGTSDASLIQIRDDMATNLVQSVAMIPLNTSKTPGQIMAAASSISSETSQLSSSSALTIGSIVSSFLAPAGVKSVGGLETPARDSALYTIYNLLQYHVPTGQVTPVLDYLHDLAESMVLNNLCGEDVMSASVFYDDLFVASSHSVSDVALEIDLADSVGVISLPTGSSEFGSCYQPLVSAFKTSPFLSDTGANALASAVINLALMTADTSSATAGHRSFQRTLLANSNTQAYYNLTRSGPAPSSKVRPVCQYRETTNSAWTVDSDGTYCEVTGSTANYTLLRTTYQGLVSVKYVNSTCQQHTSCLQCNAADGCGWCNGACLDGNDAGAFYPATCAAENWSYSSCPCTSYSSCGPCLSDSDPVTGRTKRECGWCPSTKTCHAGTDSGPSDGAKCPAWNVNWVYGFNSSCPTDQCHSSCYSHGACVDFTECQCNEGWEDGESAEELCTEPICESCVHGSCTAPEVCDCADDSWGGAWCDITTDCSEHGTYDAEEKKCSCDMGYGSKDCSVQISCTVDCGAHGTCEYDAVLQVSTCACDETYYGNDCSAVATAYVDVTFTLQGNSAYYTSARLAEVRSNLAIYLGVNEDQVSLVSTQPKSGAIILSVRVYCVSVDEAHAVSSLLTQSLDTLSDALNEDVLEVSDPEVTDLNETSGSGEEEEDVKGAIAGGVIGGFFGVVLIGAGVWYTKKRRSSAQATQESPGDGVFIPIDV